MKLTYQFEKTTSADISILISETFFYLKELDYSITSNRNNIITFKFVGGFGLAPRGQNMNRVHNGLIEFNRPEQETVVKLTYSISITLQLLIIVAFLIMGIFKGVFMLVALVVLFVCIFSVFITKARAEEMIVEILKRVKNNIIKA
ncbi:MAG: hypothetical protein V4592_27145 [Bacteroidota bacterium]